jgi:hypothetical protein
MVKLGLVSYPEWELLEAIRELKFGEMYGVEMDLTQDQWMDYKLTPAITDFLLYLRSGIPYIDVLTVHNGQPVIAETDLKIDKFKCRRRVKFPTG